MDGDQDEMWLQNELNALEEACKSAPTHGVNGRALLFAATHSLLGADDHDFEFPQQLQKQLHVYQLEQYNTKKILQHFPIEDKPAITFVMNSKIPTNTRQQILNVMVSKYCALLAQMQQICPDTVCEVVGRDEGFRQQVVAAAVKQEEELFASTMSKPTYVTRARKLIPDEKFFQQESDQKDVGGQQQQQQQQVEDEHVHKKARRELDHVRKLAKWENQFQLPQIFQTEKECSPNESIVSIVKINDQHRQKQVLENDDNQNNNFYEVSKEVQAKIDALFDEDDEQSDFFTHAKTNLKKEYLGQQSVQQQFVNIEEINISDEEIQKNEQSNSKIETVQSNIPNSKIINYDLNQTNRNSDCSTIQQCKEKIKEKNILKNVDEFVSGDMSEFEKFSVQQSKKQISEYIVSLLEGYENTKYELNKSEYQYVLDRVVEKVMKKRGMQFDDLKSTDKMQIFQFVESYVKYIYKKNKSNKATQKQK